MKVLGLLVVLPTILVSCQAHVIHNPIQLDVYYESQCQYCKNFFVQELRPTSQLLSRYLSVNLVPYGNAKTVRNGEEVVITCQHGPSECVGNKIHACAFACIPTSEKQVLMASCLFDYSTRPYKGGEMCSRQFGLDWSDIKTCADGEGGAQLLDMYGNQTRSVNAASQGVPAIHINGRKIFPAACY